jgi:hypothetical protein
MATAPGSTEPLAVASWEAADPAGEPSKSDRYLARRLAAAGADVKGVAVATFLLAAGLGVVAWLASGVVVEHWLVPGGLPAAARWAWLATGVAGLALAAARWLLPLVRYRVNLVYAARAIEQEHPDLHNDLVNAVLVKSQRDKQPPLVVRSLERRAAKRLSTVTAEGVIDRTPAFRLAVALAALVAAACLYEIFAPKSLLVSAARLLAPWSTLAAPSRVTIDPPRLAWRLPAATAGADGERMDHELASIEGTATLVRGRQLVVACDIRGLRSGEPATLTVTPVREDGTVDPAAVPWQVPLVGAGGSGRHMAVLPDATRGLQHSVDLLVGAGDAPERRLRVVVVDTPSLLVSEVRYDYPAYTRLEPETVAWQGDVRAVEGTRVTIVAQGNRPLKAAWIDKGCDGSKDIQLRVGTPDKTRATGSFTLRHEPARESSGSGSYRLVFEPASGAAPAREETVVERLEHRIEVVPDLAPEVSIEDPREQVLLVPPDAPVAVGVRALDPDFGLARVGVEMRLAGGGAQTETVLFQGDRSGVFAGGTEIVPARLGAGPGSVIEYRAIAVDSKPEPANVAHSPWQVLRVEAGAVPREPRPRPDDSARDGQQEPAADGKSQRGDAGAEGRADDARRDRERQDQPKRSAAQDPQAAGEEEASEPAAGAQSGGQGAGEGEGRGEQAGASQAGGEQQRGSQQGSDQQGSDQQGSDQQGSDQQGSERDGSKQQAGNQQGGAPDGGRQRAGDQPGGAQQDGARQEAGEQQGGAQQRAREQGDHEQSDQRSGQREPQAQQGDGSRQPADGQQQGGGRDQAEQSGQGGQRQAGDRQGGDQQSGDRQQGAGETGTRREAVSADGTNDGEAVERILEQRRRDGQAPPAGEREPRAGEEQNSSQCNPAEGKPCSKEGCSSCNGGGKRGGAGAGSQSSGAGSASGGEKPDAERSGQQGSQESDNPGSEQGGEQGGGQGGEQAGGQEGGQPGPQGGGPSGDRSGAGREGPQGREAAERQGQGGKPAGGQPGAGDQPAAGPPEAAAGAAADSKPAEPGQAAGANGGREDAAAQAGSDGTPAAGSAAGSSQAPAAMPAAGASGAKPAASGGPVGAGGHAGGDGGRAGAGDDGPPHAGELEWTEQDRAHARNAADLAIEHLRDSLAAGRRDVLDALGWTPEQARAFLERWQSLRRLAGSSDVRERGEFDRALRSLGLRPSGVTSSREVPADAPGGQAEGRRSRPPASYREQFKAYLQGTDGE